MPFLFRLLIFCIFASAELSFIQVKPAMAGCTDPAAPAVDWYRCYMESRTFRSVDLTGARLREARFNRGTLSGSDLTLVDGRRAKFFHAELVQVKFDKARLTEADFTNANLEKASFRDANLSRARFFRSNLKEVDFTGAELTGVDLQKADLSGAIWIDGEHVCAGGSIGQCN